MKLTKRTVESIPVPARGYVIKWDDELPKFGVRVTEKGVRAYVIQGRVNRKERRPTIGRHGVLTTEQARKIARIKLGEMANGVDHVAEKRRAKACAVTLTQVMEDYLQDRHKLKPRSRANIRYHVEKSFADWSNKPIVLINRDKVATHFRELSSRSLAHANQAFRNLQGLLSYARARYRTPDDLPILPENPVAVLSHARMWHTIKPRNTYVPIERAGMWWSAVQELRADPLLAAASRAAADLVAILALTGLRLGEARTLRWEQVDLEGGSLRLTDTKNGDDIRLPLSALAIEILKARPNRTPWVFPARIGSGHLMSCSATLRKLTEATGIKVSAHDLRRTFRAVAGKVGIELWRTKALMNHRQTKDVTLAHYTDLEDVRYLKPETDRIAHWLEDQRRIAMAGNVTRLEVARGGR